MAGNNWRELLYRQGAGTARTAAAEDEIVDDVTIPAGYMTPGRILEATIVGIASNAVTTPGTLTLRARWGTISGTVLVASAALTQNVAAQTDKVWWWKIYIHCLTSGATGTFMTAGTAHRGNCAVAVVADITPDLVPAASLAAVTVDTTIAKALTFTVAPSLTTASIQALTYILESVG